MVDFLLVCLIKPYLGDHFVVTAFIGVVYTISVLFVFVGTLFPGV